MRSVTSFNDGWLFEGKEEVSLPHTAVELPFAYFDERSYQRPFTYTKTFTADPAWTGREVALVFDGAMANARAWINGEAAGAHGDGYTPFEVRLTGRLTPGSVGAGVVDAAVNGELEPERVAALIVGYLAPSLDTTISGLGSAMWLLATHPEQWEMLRRRPELVPTAFSEVLRLESPIRVFSRAVTAPALLGDVTLAEGARVAVLYGAANRDPLQFADPGSFAVDRANAGEHLGFGYGVHGCAGQGLARLESHALLTAMIKSIARIELAGPAVRATNNLINGWAQLPVRVVAAG